MSDHFDDANKMVGGDDVCSGCVHRHPDRVHDLDCLKCKRWWPDKYKPGAAGDVPSIPAPDITANAADTARSVSG